jgi:Base plate wedge protein 53
MSSRFLDDFPILLYDIDNIASTKVDLITDITFRVKFIEEVLNNISAYYTYIIQDGDRPDILAETFYKDPTLHWVILLANHINDIHYDWPMDNNSFIRYIKDKYGSVANAQTSIHHYEKVIERHNSTTDITSTFRFVIDQDKIANNSISVPYDSWTSLADVQSVATFEVQGDTITERIFRDEISNYQYEVAKNDEKRTIKIIKSQYVASIKYQFESLTGTSSRDYRGVI